MRILVFLLLVPSLIACTAARPKSSTLLEPATWELDAQPKVVSVNPDSDVANKIDQGDKLLSVDGRPTPTYSKLVDLLSETNDFDGVARFRTTAGDTVQLSMEKAFLGNDGNSPITWVQPGATAAPASFENPDGEEQRSGIIYAGELSAAAAVRRWETAPPLLEIQLAISASSNCEGCGFKDLRVLDLSHNSWIQPIPMNKAAWAVYPDLGERGETVAVPPPTPAGGTAFSNTYGTVNAQSYGNTTYGTYQGSTTTTYYPNYDYSATNAASMHNLGVAIRNARITNQNRARREFVALRQGNLRLGQLDPSEQMVGHVFYALPAGFDGPFGIEIVSQSGEAAWVRFDTSPDEGVEK